MQFIAKQNVGDRSNNLYARVYPDIYGNDRQDPKASDL